MLRGLREGHMGRLLLDGKINKKQFIEMLESDNPIIRVPLDKACGYARTMKKKISQLATRNEINADTAVQCILREAVGSKNDSCEVLQIWNDPVKRPSFVTDDLVRFIEEGLSVVQQTAKKVLSRVDLTPDELVEIVCDKCRLC